MKKQTTPNHVLGIKKESKMAIALVIYASSGNQSVLLKLF